jgi:hypothetical protein
VELDTGPLSKEEGSACPDRFVVLMGRQYQDGAQLFYREWLRNQIAVEKLAVQHADRKINIRNPFPATDQEAVWTGLPARRNVPPQ